MIVSIRIASIALLAMMTLPALADEDNTRRLLNQIDRSIVEREQSYLPQEPPDIDPSSRITIDGTVIPPFLALLKSRHYAVMASR